MQGAGCSIAGIFFGLVGPVSAASRLRPCLLNRDCWPRTNRPFARSGRPNGLRPLDHRIGSIDVGKDADVVIWTGHPFSTYSRVDTTFVDGQVVFDRERDLQLRKDRAKEKADRLKKEAGFSFVPKPLAIRNSKNAIVYYLFLASPKAVAERIISDIFHKYDSGLRLPG